METPENCSSYAEDMEEDPTPRTSSVEQTSTPPPPEGDSNIEPEMRSVHEEDPLSTLAGGNVHISPKNAERDTLECEDAMRTEVQPSLKSELM